MRGSSALRRMPSTQRSKAPADAPMQMAAMAFSNEGSGTTKRALSPGIDPPLGEHDVHLREPRGLLDARGARRGFLRGVDGLQRDAALRRREARKVFRRAVALQRRGEI